MAEGDTFINIGTKLFVGEGRPADATPESMASMTVNTRVNGVISIPAAGDTTQDVSEPELDDGRVEHFNGQVDGTELQIPIKKYEGDAGQALLLRNATTNQSITLREETPDGRTLMYWARVASMQEREKTPNSFAGYTLILRVNSARIEVGSAGASS